MTNDDWNTRRAELEQRLTETAVDLLRHSGAASFSLPLGDGQCLAVVQVDDAASLEAMQEALVHARALLVTAKCPDCDGRDAACQWCRERDAVVGGGE